MAATNEARFVVNGDPSEDGAGDRGYDAALTEVLTLAIEASPTPVLSVLFEVFDPTDDSSPRASLDAPLLTFTGSGTAKQLLATPSGSAELTMPGSGVHAWRVRCTVSLPDGPQVFERLIVIRSLITTPPLRKTVPAESTEYEARGYSDALNEMVEAIINGPGGGGETNTASNVGSGAGVFKTKVIFDLRFKSLVAGPGIVISPAADEITFSSELFTTAPINIYIDGDGGNDANDGSIGSPVQTRAGAYALLPRFIRHVTKLHYRTAAAAYALGPAPSFVLEDAPLIEFVDEAWDSGVFTAYDSGIAAAGTGATVVKDAGLTVDDYQYKTIRMTSGAAVGQFRSVRNNTATDIVPMVKFSPAPAPGDTYEIIDPVVEFDLESLGGDDAASLGSNLSKWTADTSGTIESAKAAHVFVGFDFSHATANRKLTGHGAFAFYGCAAGPTATVANFGGQVWAGCDSRVAAAAPAGRAAIPSLYLGAADDKAWLGWGTMGFAPTADGYVGGFMAALSIAPTGRGRYEYLGGFTRLLSSQTVRVTVGAQLDGGDEIKFLIDDQAAFATFNGLASASDTFGPSGLLLSLAQINASGTNTGIRASGAGAVVIVSPTNVTGESASGLSIAATDGGRVHFLVGGDPVYGRAAGNDYRAGSAGPSGSQGCIEVNKAMLTAGNTRYIHAADGSLILTGQNHDGGLTRVKDFAITPPQLVADVTDYDPTNLQLATVIRVSSDASRDVNGLAPPSNGVERHIIVNVGAFRVVLKDGTGSAGYQFEFGTDVTLGPFDAVEVRYDGTTWKATSKFSATAVSSTGVSDDEAIARYDGVTGALIQNSLVKINDAGEFRDWLYKAISPAAIAAQQDDYNPTGWDDADLVLLSLTGDQSISGFAAVAANAGVPRKIVVNTSATDSLLILNDDPASVAANRVLTPGDDGLEYRLDPGESAVLFYDYTSSRWRVQNRDSRIHVTDFRFLTETTIGSYNDYNPTGWSKADALLYSDGSEGGDTYFTGFEANVVQKRKHVVNLQGGPVHLLHLDGASAAANRIICPRGINVVLERYESAMLLYTGGKWSVVAVAEQESIQSVQDAFAAQQDDYSPANWATLDILVANPTGAQTITGFEQILSHQFKMIVNSSGTDDPLTLASEHAGSAIGNRIRTMDDDDLVLQKGEVAIIAYDETLGRWRVVAPTQPDTVNAITDALAANQNNYSPVGWNHADLLRLTMAADRTITGFARLNSHNRKTILNAGPGTLSLTHQDGASAAGNQIRTPTGATITVPAGYAVELAYDSAVLYWYVVESTPLASTTEVLTGTAVDRAVTPNALAALWEKGANVASAATVSLGEGGYFHITGVTTITDIDFATPKDGRVALVIFDGVLTLTHNATTLQLPGGANIVTAAGDRACFVQDASDNVICLWYQRAALVRPVPVFWGGASMGGGDVGKHFTAHGDANDNLGRSATLDFTNQMVTSHAGTLNRFGWNSATGDATTVFKVNKNGAVVETVTLTGASGTAALTTTYALGDKLAVEFDSGTAPGQTNVQVYGASSL